MQVPHGPYLAFPKNNAIEKRKDRGCGESWCRLGFSMRHSGGSAVKHEIPHCSGTHTGRVWMVGLLASEVKPTFGKRNQQQKSEVGAISCQAGFDRSATSSREHKAPLGT